MYQVDNSVVFVHYGVYRERFVRLIQRASDRDFLTTVILREICLASRVVMSSRYDTTTPPTKNSGTT